MLFKRARDQKGLTLIEVILSIVILSVGIISVQRAFIGSLSVLGRIENWEQAEGLLQKKIWEIERDIKEDRKSLNGLNGNGTLMGQNRSYRYEINTKALDLDGRLGAVRIKVFEGSKPLGRAIARDFYLWIPDANKTSSSI